MEVLVNNVGTVLKININLEPTGGYRMEDLDFVCRFFVYANRYVECEKHEMKKVDSDNYVAIVDTGIVGSGNIRCKMSVWIPDGDVQGGRRLEVVTFDTGLNVKA